MKSRHWLVSGFVFGISVIVFAACDSVSEQDLRSSSAEVMTYDAQGKPIVECNGKMIRLNEDHGPCDPPPSNVGTLPDNKLGNSASSTTTTTLPAGGSSTTTTMANTTTTTTMPSVPEPLRTTGETRGLLKRSTQNNSQDGAIWIFELPQSLTGNQAWNSLATAFELKRGETLRVYNGHHNSNMQGQRHTIHASGNPCPHGGNRRYSKVPTPAEPNPPSFQAAAPIPLGGWLECDIPTGATLGDIPTSVNGQGGTIYDHNTNGSIYIRIIE